MKPLSILLATAAVVVGQHNASTSNGCNDGFYPGTDTVIYTVPYTYSQVMSIIGSYRNITWSGSPYNTVTLNGTDNTVGTARTYDIVGAHIVETITKYSQPPNGPYEEIHTLDLITVPAANVSVYGDYDGTTVTPICNGKASTFNFTINYCATNASLAASLLHMLHLTDAQTVGVFLGGQNFTSCGTTNATTTGMMPTSTQSIITTSNAGQIKYSFWMISLVGGLVGLQL